MRDGSRTDQQMVQPTLGDGLPCSSCGHPVEPSEALYRVTLRGLPYDFHTACYRVWRVESQANR